MTECVSIRDRTPEDRDSRGQTGANTEITPVQPQARACLGSLELEAAREDSALGVLDGPTPAVHMLAPSTEGE